MILVGPNNEFENRTRGLALALHSLWYNYLQEHLRPVYLFFGDDVPADQYAPEVIQAIAPHGMVAEAVPVPGFERPPDNMRTVVLHNIVGRYPGEQLLLLRGRNPGSLPEPPQHCMTSSYARR